MLDNKLGHFPGTAGLGERLDRIGYCTAVQYPIRALYYFWGKKNEAGYGTGLGLVIDRWKEPINE